MIKIILQDIDNVSYPFKEKHTNFLIEEKLISKEFAEKFLASKKPYLIDYLLDEMKKGNCINTIIAQIYKKYSEKTKEIKQKLKEKKLNREGMNEQELELESMFFATFQDFFESHHYANGTIKEISELNNKLKQKNSKIKIIGITARATHVKKEPEIFKYLSNKTHEWNKTNEAGLDEIYFEHKKINAYYEIINKEENKNKDIVCFLEDDPNNLEEFLKKGITCVLIQFDYYDKEELVIKLKKEYKEKLKIVQTHEEASRIIQELV